MTTKLLDDRANFKNDFTINGERCVVIILIDFITLQHLNAQCIRGYIS